MKLSDYVIKFLSEQKIGHIFQKYQILIGKSSLYS